MKKGLFFFLTLVFVGLLDLITTCVGVTCFGAVESNPLMAGITVASPLVFCGIKLLASVMIGAMFYKAGSMPESVNNHFVLLSYSFSMIFMMYVVTNNFLVLFRLA